MGRSERQARAAARRGAMRIVKARLGDPEVDLSPVRGEAAISLVTQLTRESWAEAGRELPRYGRTETPFRFVRGWPP